MQSNSQTPAGWSRARLGDVAEVVGGSTPSRAKSEYWGGNIPWVAPSELTDLNGRYLDCSRESISEQGLKAAGLRVLPPGSVLLTSRATIGTTAINKVAVTTNQGFQSLIPNSETDGLWLYYGVSALRRELERRSAGSTFREISRDGVRSLPILVPPLREQRAIAAILDSIDEAIERTEDVVAAIERLRDALLHDLLTRGLPGRHTEFKQVRGLGTIPASWSSVRLGEVAEVNPQRPNLDVDPRTIVTFVPMVAVGEDCSGIIAPERREYREVSSGYTYFEDDDVLFAKITPCLQNGKHALAGEIDNGFGFGTTEFHVLRSGTELDPRLLYRLVTRRSILEKCQKSFSGTAGQQRIQPEVLRSLLLPLPPFDEQRAITGLLSSLDQTLVRNAENRDKLEAAKASTADALLTGRATPFLRPDVVPPEV